VNGIGLRGTDVAGVPAYGAGVVGDPGRGTGVTGGASRGAEDVGMVEPTADAGATDGRTDASGVPGCCADVGAAAPYCAMGHACSGWSGALCCAPDQVPPACGCEVGARYPADGGTGAAGLDWPEAGEPTGAEASAADICCAGGCAGTSGCIPAGGGAGRGASREDEAAFDVTAGSGEGRRALAADGAGACAVAGGGTAG
jgi:hypothetical protein